MTTNGPSGGDYREPEDLSQPTSGSAPSPSAPPQSPAPAPAPATAAAAEAAPVEDDGFSKEELLATLKKWAIILVVGLIAVMIAAAVIPRWWAQRVGDVVDGSLTKGTIVGIALGFICTLLPLLFLTWAVRKRDKGALPIILLIIGLVTALPNLATLWITIGGGGGAKAGRQVLTDDAPFFRGGTLIGFLAGAALGGYIIWGMFQRDRQAKKLAEASATEDPSPKRSR